jgi:cytidylate kinase
MADTPRLVITISRQIGSGGTIVGQLAAKRLGLNYVDAEILQRAADMLGVQDPRSLEALEEHAPGGLWGRFARAVSIGAPDAPFVPSPPGVYEGHVQEVEREIIREIAAHRNAVIVGRGAAHLLSGPFILRVFVHAPRAWRIERVREGYSLAEAEAREMVLRSDKRRADFVRELRGCSWTDACLYDLTIDTSVVGIEMAAGLVAEIAGPRLQLG